MRLSIQVPDEIYDAYLRQATVLAARGNGHSNCRPEDLMVAQLDRFQHVAPMDRVVVIDSASRETLEKVLTGGHVSSGADLVAKVAELANLKIGHVEVDFTTKQWELLANYAGKNDLTVEEAAKAVVRGMQENFFDWAY
jgi:hypothetical protein